MDNLGYFKDSNEEIEKSEKGVKLEPEPEKVYSFEEAAALTGTGYFHYFLFLLSGLCFMSVMVETMGTSVILPFTKCELGSTITEQGFLASSGFLGIVLSSHLMGFLADTWGRVKTLRVSLVFGFITTVISAFSVNMWMLIVFRFLNGFFMSGCQACVFSFLGEFHGYKTRLKYVTLLSVFMPIGIISFAGISIGVLPIDIDATVLGLKFESWRVLLLANSTLSLLALCGLLLTPESPKYVLIQGKHKEALDTFRKVFRLNTGKPESEYPVMQLHSEVSGASLSSVHGMRDACKLIWNQTVPLFYKDRVLHTLNICCHMFFIYGVAQGTVMWFPTMIEQLDAKTDQGYLACEAMHLLDNAVTNATTKADSCSAPVNTRIFKILSLCGVEFTVCYLIISASANFVEKKKIMWALFCISLVCSLLIQWVSSFIWSVILLTLFQNIGNCGGIVGTISLEYFPTNTSAMAMCLVYMCGRLGAVAFSNIIGALLFTNCNALFYLYVGVIAVLMLFSLFLPKTEGPTKINK